MKRALTLALLLAVCGVLGGSAQADVTGSWVLEITDPFGSASDIPLTLEQDGGTLAGMAGDRPLEGTVEGSGITMSYEVPDTQVGPMTLEFEGKIDGAGMEGTVLFGQFASGTWTAAREE